MKEMEHAADEQLVEMVVIDGQLRAFDHLIQRHTGKIFSLIRGLDGSADTEDLVQDTFVKAYQNLAKFKNHSTFSTWLYRIAVNTVRDHQRRAARNPVVDIAPPSQHPGASHERPDNRFAHRELDAEIRNALDSLSPKLRTAIVCHAVEGMSIAQIAKIEKCAQATIHWRIHAARKKLKHILLI
jgi:RNA polymerase sigma-70 factor, ECF subfamily